MSAQEKANLHRIVTELATTITATMKQLETLSEKVEALIRFLRGQG